MKSVLLVFFVLVLLIPAAGRAQDTPPPSPKDDLYRGNSLPAPDPADQEKTLQDIFIPEEDAPEPEKDATSVDLANAYFLKCKNEEQNYLRPETKEYLCGCTAAKMAQHLTPEEILALEKEGKAGDLARANYIIKAYASCIYKPVADVSKHRCLASNQIKNVWAGRWKVCRCTATFMEDYAHSAGHVVLSKVLLESPMHLDPLEGYIDSEGFYAQMSGYMTRCIREYAYGD